MAFSLQNNAPVGKKRTFKIVLLVLGSVLLVGSMVLGVLYFADDDGERFGCYISGGKMGVASTSNTNNTCEQVHHSVKSFEANRITEGRPPIFDDVSYAHVVTQYCGCGVDKCFDEEQKRCIDYEDYAIGLNDNNENYEAR